MSDVSTSALSHLRELRTLLQAFQFRFQNEAQLQEAIAGVLEREGYEVQREKPITQVSRLDFYLPVLRVGIEVKVQGSQQAAWRQVERYLEHEDVDGMLLAGSRYWASRDYTPGPFSASNPKPIAVAYLARPL